MQIIKKPFVRAFSVFILVIFFFSVLESVLGNMLCTVGGDAYFRDEMAGYEKEGQKADMIFLGSSRSYCGYMPEIFEEALGMDMVINCGTGTQRPESSYYMLKDMYRRFSPKTVVYCVQWSTLLSESTDSQRLESAVTAYDRMSSPGKIEYAARYLGSDMFPNFFYTYRFRNKFRIEEIKKNIDKSRQYRKNGYTVDYSANSYYLGKGFVYMNHNQLPGNIAIMDELQDTFDVEVIDENKLQYLDKITEFCRRKGIELYLMPTPIAMMNIYHINGYEEADEYFRKYAEEKGITYINLNCLKDREEWLGDDKMADYVHLSGAGAELLSEKAAEILNLAMKGEDYSEYLYKDVDELKENIYRVVALRYRLDLREEGKVGYSIESLQNDDITPLYCVEYSLDGGENYEKLTDWSEESSGWIELPAESCTLKFCAWSGVEGEPIAWQEKEIGGE